MVEPIEAWSNGISEKKEWCIRNLRTAEDEMKFYQLYGIDYVENLIHLTRVNNSFIESGKQCYSFDADFVESIVNETWVDLLPEVIKYAPHNCFYLKVPIGKWDGFIVQIVEVLPSNKNAQDAEFNEFERWATNHIGVKGVHIMNDPKTIIISDGTKAWSLFGTVIPCNSSMQYEPEALEEYPFNIMPNAVAYICSKNADIISHVSSKQKRSSRSSSRRRPTWSKVGYRIGNQLRAYNQLHSEQGSQHANGSVRPHVRRAHWHHYWVGPSSDRRLVLKWLAPIFVALKNGPIDSITSHEVPT